MRLFAGLAWEVYAKPAPVDWSQTVAYEVPSKDMRNEDGDMDLDDLTVVASDSVLFQELADEMVLLDLSSGEYYGLNEIGSRIWLLLQQGQTVMEVIGTLLQEHDVSEDRLKEDVERFLQTLQTRGLIEIVRKDAP